MMMMMILPLFFSSMYHFLASNDLVVFFPFMIDVDHLYRVCLSWALLPELKTID